MWFCKSIIGMWPSTLRNNEQIKVVLQIRTNARLVKRHLNPHATKMIRWPNARQLQQARRTDRPR